MKFLKYLLIIGLLLGATKINAQLLNHEIGAIIGPISFQGDYGQRSSFTSSIANVGIGVGAVYYVSFNQEGGKWYDRSSYMKNHLRLRAEYSYMSTKLRHFGNTNIKMLALTGKTKMSNLGGQLEFSIYDLDVDRAWKPFLSTGFTYTTFNPEIESSLGDWRTDPSLLPQAYLNGGMDLGKNKTQSFVFGGGTRYDVGNFNVVFEMRWQRFLTDSLDGLTPKIEVNKYNDWLMLTNVGVVYSFY